jgi:hypothetical protein
MPLSWNEIRSRAHAFAKEWADAESENAQAKPFWIEFFKVFGISSKRVASFEEPVRKLGDKQGFIDLLWKGTLLVEHKSRGKDLDKAYTQALDYFPGLKERDLPKYVVVSDFARIRLYDLEAGTKEEFSLKDFPKHIRLFGFIAGYQTRHFGQEDPVNAKAAEHLGRLHDQLKASGYEGHALEVFLVRVLFCLFAEDTAIYEKRQFQDYIETRTAPDGSDLGMHLAQLWQVLDTAHDKRQKALDEQLAAFPYVNGQLYREQLAIAAFDSAMRETLLDCCALDWSRISPAVFGSLFQSIMDAKARRAIGAHYTSETNILRLIRPLFLDALWAEFEKVKHNRNKLFEFLKKLAGLRFLDPACGCGNFLVIAYRELRLLELEVLRHVRDSGQMHLDIFQLVQIDVDQFHGIEIEEWPARIAEVALWLTDHQMNMRVSEEFGDYYVRLPLKHAPHIVHGNALTLDWNDVIPAERLDYLLGNPPFVGKHYQDRDQKAELLAAFEGLRGASDLDYVACWYRKAAEYMTPRPEIRAAFVSTNSITQGEQVGILWPDLYRLGVKIHFAHRTFQWTSEARGKAAVHCVIVGFGLQDVAEKWLFDYDSPKSEPHAIKAGNINAYLADAPDVIAYKRQQPLAPVPIMRCGNKPSDGGHLLLTPEEKAQLLAVEPGAAPWLKRYMGSEEFINGIERWCLWLDGIAPDVLRKLPQVRSRVEAVHGFRLKSSAEPTRRMADNSTRFFFVSQPTEDYILIPEVSSERRRYVPVGLMPAEVISSNKNYLIAGRNLYVLGALQSAMHMAWLATVGGRLKSDFQYSATMVYNTFPWPDPTDKQRTAIEAAAQAVLDARTQFPGATLADLYDPLAMPPGLLKAHQQLDRAVDMAYGVKSFKSEAERVAFLFERYQTQVSLLTAEKPAKRRAKAAKTTS